MALMPVPGSEEGSSLDHCGWRFEANSCPLWGSTEIDSLARSWNLFHVPDMFCGSASLCIHHAVSGRMLRLCALDALHCCRFAPPPPTGLQPSAEEIAATAASAEEMEAVAPAADGGGGSGSRNTAVKGPLLGAVQCQFASAWRPVGESSDIREMQVVSDWTCTTSCWGAFLDASQLPLLHATTATDEELPLDLLRRHDEILWYKEILLWEDELGDNGLCRCLVRLRVMPTFWYALLSCELRVDNVLLREVSTRFFGAFEANYILREWTWKEAAFEDLQRRRGGVGVLCSPQISQSESGMALLDQQEDVKRRLRHRLWLLEQEN